MKGLRSLLLGVANCLCRLPRSRASPNQVKPEETLVEARSGSDVQIDRQIWV